MKTFTRPLPIVTIPPNSDAIISSATVSPGNTLYPVGITISEKIASSLVIQDIKIGQNSQLAAGYSVPGSLFSDEQTPVLIRLDRLRLDRLQSGLRLHLNVSNKSSRPIEFSGNIVCTLEERPTNWPVIVGLGQNTVDRTVTITIRPYGMFEPTYLHVPPHLLDVFEIISLETERYLDSDVDSMVHPTCLASKYLREIGKIAFNPHPVIPAGHPIFLKVSNKMSTPRVFQGAILGLSHPNAQ